MALRKLRILRRHEGRDDEEPSVRSGLREVAGRNTITTETSLVFENSMCIEGNSEIIDHLSSDGGGGGLIPRNALTHPESNHSSSISTEQICLTSTEIHVSSVRSIESPTPLTSSRLRRERLSARSFNDKMGGKQSSSRNDIRLLLKRIDAIEAENRKLRGCVADLEKRCSETDEGERRAVERLHHETMEREVLAKELQNQKKRCQELLKEMEERSQMLSTSEALVDKQKRSIERLQEELEAVKEKAEAGAPLEEAQAEIEMMRYEKKSMFRVGEIQRKELEERTMKLEETRAENEQLAVQVAELKKKNAALLNSSEKVNETLAEVRKEKASLSSRVELLQQTDELRTAKIANLNKEVNDLKKEMICLQYDMDRTNRESGRILSQFENLKVENSCLSKDGEHARQTIKELQSLLDTRQSSELVKEVSMLREMNWMLAAKDRELSSMKQQLERNVGVLKEVKRKIEQAKQPIISENQSLLRLSESPRMKMAVTKLQSLQVNYFNDLQALLSTAMLDFTKEVPLFSSDSLFKGENFHDFFMQSGSSGSSKGEGAQWSGGDEQSACRGPIVNTLLDAPSQTELAAAELDEALRAVAAKHSASDVGVQTDEYVAKKAKRCSDEEVDDQRMKCQKAPLMDEKKQEQLMQVNRMLWLEVKADKKNLKIALRRYKEAKDKLSDAEEKLKKMLKSVDKIQKDHRNVMTVVDNLARNSLKMNWEEKAKLQISNKQFLDEVHGIQENLKTLLK